MKSFMLEFLTTVTIIRMYSNGNKRPDICEEYNEVYKVAQ